MFNYNLITTLMWGLTLLACLLSGCNSVFSGPSSAASDGGHGGEATLPEGVLHLPFATGESHLCTQGAGGGYSHNATSTHYGLDLDTDNSHHEDVFAPASGTAYVHYDTSLTGFGYHINIDLGDGTYVVLAHLDDVFIENEAEVAAGQLVGYEGCTGNCTGDHLHLDLHQGWPDLMAQHGTSLLTSYMVRDVTSGSDAMVLQSDHFTCDLSSGHHYESQLPVVSWHPDGTLLKKPDSAEIFVVDRNDIHWIEHEEIFESYGFYWDDVVVMSEHELWCWPENGSIISEPTEYRAVYDEHGTTWIAFEPADDPGRYRQAVHAEVEDEVLNSWGISVAYTHNEEPGSEILNDYPVADDHVHLRDGTLVEESGSSAIYAVHEGAALPIKNWETYLLLGFERRFVFSVPEDSLRLAVDEIGSCETDIGCISTETVTSCGEHDLSISFADDDDDDDHPSHGDDDDDTDNSSGPGDDDDDTEIGDDDDVVSDDDDTVDLGDDDDTVGDDDDIVSDDDDTEIGDDDIVSDDDVADDDDDTVAEEEWLLLEVEGHLDGAWPDHLLLEGELLDENDSPSGGGFWWATLEEVTNNNTVTWNAYVKPDWTFRHSYEYERYGVTSWSCLAPYPPGTITMDLSAWVDGTPVTVEPINNYLGGCELLIEVP